MSIFLSEAKKLGIPKELVLEVLNNHKFKFYPASIDKHHCFLGGLEKHTEEVYDLAKYTLTKKRQLSFADECILLLGSLYHDFGKIEEYNVTFDEGQILLVERKSKYEKGAHIVVSFRMFIEKIAEIHKAKKTCINKHIQDEIAHCILSHHGEYGSEIQPKTDLAWAIHLADMTSANVIGDRWRNIF